MRRLYVLHQCPFGHRASFALREKQLDFDLVFFEVGKRPPELEALGPRAKSPTLFDGETKVYESLAVVEYLEDRYPENSLLPNDPAQRAQVRMWIARGTEEIGDKQSALIAELFKKERDAAKIEAAKRAFLDKLPEWDAELADRAFVCGPALSLADVAIYPFFVSVKSHAGVEIPGELRHLRAWFERIQARPASALPRPA